MSSISLKSGKREAGVKQFFADMKENPITFFLICILTFSLLSYFSPLGGFFIRHHKLFGVIVAVSVVPTGVFIWVLYMKYGQYILWLPP